ncbi:MAG: family 10 glycosylhydrolase [Bacteroidales bacterium]|nr:family 10 glycosylhydrolase [Bacteroidales bacterium]
MRRLLHIGLVLTLLASCATDDPANYKWREEWRDVQEPENPQDPDNSGLPEIKGKPRYIWIDAAANFQYYANDAAYIEADCQRIAKMGFTDIIVDVRPTSGDVLFSSSVAPACTKVAAWVKGGYKWVERTATFDYLGTFIVAGHTAGLRVNAAINTMVGGYHSSIGDAGMLYNKPELKSWCSVDNLPLGLTNAMDDSETGPRFLDPANPQVQQFLITLLGELASYEGLDGIVLDRCRYDDYNLDAGYTDSALAAFTEYLGDSPKNWPVVPQGTVYLTSPNTLQRNWLTFRCKTIKGFVEKAAAKVHEVAPDIRFGVYVGAWFSEYYRAGVNWTSTTYNLKSSESTYKWATEAYQKTGFADLLDFIFLGAYAGTNGIHGSGEWTMEGFAKLGAKRLCGVVPFAAGPDIGNGSGFENGKQEAIIPDIVDTILKNAGGLFIFDLCHIRMFDYWDAFEQAINSYLNTL